MNFEDVVAVGCKRNGCSQIGADQTAIIRKKATEPKKSNSVIPIPYQRREQNETENNPAHLYVRPAPAANACGGNDGTSADSTQTGGSAEETLPTTDEPGER